MKLPPRIRPVLRADSGRSDSPADIDAEIQFHLESRIERLVQSGMSPEAAREQALREFGPTQPVAAQVRAIDAHRQTAEQRRDWVAGAWHDIRMALRGMRRAPLYALVATLTFALGIGANAAVFSLLDGVVLRPLPFPALDRLVRIYEHDHNESHQFGQVTIADFRDWKSQTRSFERLAAFRYRHFTVTGTDEAVSLMGGMVTPEFFDLLGVRPAIGRDFQPEEGRPGANPVVILSHEAWVRLFGADAGIVGQTIQLNSEATEVIGVLPAGFVSPLGQPLDAWATSDFDANANDQARARRMHFLASFGRIREGVSREAAEEELLTVGRRLERDYPGDNAGHLPQMVPLQEAGTASARPVLLLVMGAVALVLLIACANLTNLVFARTLSRSRELAVRTALGAGRWRMIRQVMIEQLLLALIGGGVGLIAASWTSGLFVRMLGGSIPRGDLVRMDLRVIGFALLVTFVAAVVSGLLPAIHAARAEPGDQLRAGSHGSTLSRRSHHLRAALVSLQVGLATVLLVGSAVALRSLGTLLDQDLGFEPAPVWTFTAPAMPAKYPESPQVLEFQTRLLEQIRNLPGVGAASASYGVPMANVSTTSIQPEGVVLPPGPAPEIGYNAAEASYFKVMGIPLVQGRLMDSRDHADAPLVAVVNQALVHRHWPGQDAIGKRFKSGPDPSRPWIEIIGVVGDVRRRSVQLPPEPEVYFPLTQDITRNAIFTVRIEGDPARVIPAVRSVLRSIDPDVPLGNLQPVSDIVAGALRQPRFLSSLLSGFGGLALVLAAVGIYGVIAYLVAERRREIGVRLALGAGRGTVLRETLWRGLRPVLAGLAIGLVAAIAAGRVAGNLFYEVSATDPRSLLAASAVLLTAAVLGCLAPARRAARVDPGTILRE